MNQAINVDSYLPLIHRISHLLYRHPKVLDDNAISNEDVLQQCYAEALDVAQYYKAGGVSERMWMQVNLEQRMARWARSLGTVSSAPITDEEIDEADKEPLFEDDPSVRMDAARILTMLPKENAEALRLMFGIGMDAPISIQTIAQKNGVSVAEARRYTFHTINMARELSEGRLS